MVRIIDRRGRELEWEAFARLYLTDYAIVAEAHLDVAGDEIRVVTGWYGLSGVDEDGSTLLPYATTVYGGPCGGWSSQHAGLIAGLRTHDVVVARVRSGLGPPT